MAQILVRRDVHSAQACAAQVKWNAIRFVMV
jgi:hypothetical protein